MGIMSVKIWEGPEMEGSDTEVMTMFVKAKELPSNQIGAWLLDKKDIKRLYLGAGRTDVVSIGNKQTFESLIRFCELNNIKIVCEVSVTGFKNLPVELHEVPLIVRIQDSSLEGFLTMSDSIKIDTESNVYVCKLNEFIGTNLVTLNKDLFSCDEVLFSDEEEDKK